MKPRFRILAALVALFAFSASFAEGVWASTCMGMGSMDEDGMGEMVSMPSMVSGVSHDDMVAALTHESAGDHAGMKAAPKNNSETPPCPLAVVMGSCVVLSLPAHEPVMALGSAVMSAARAAPAATPDFLFATALLRPPRA